MKKILFILPLLLLTSCLTTSVVQKPYQVKSVAIDYSKYTQNGFFITESPSVSFDYTPIGSVTVEISSGYEVLEETKDANGRPQIKYGELKTPSIYDALDELQKKCREMGANGVLNLKVSIGTITVQSIAGAYGTTNNTEAVKVTVSGMAVKR